MENNQTLMESASLLLDSAELNEAYPAYPNMVQELVTKGMVRFAVYAHGIAEHLGGFSFVKFDGCVPGYIDIIQFSFDLQSFLVSKEFFVYANTKTKELDKFVREMQEKLYEYRCESSELKVLLANASNAMLRDTQDSRLNVNHLSRTGA